MNENQTNDKNQSQMQSTEAKKPSQMKSASKIRPTKKQKELLEFIESFIEQHGYSPSYREIMTGVGYNSVATVALHVGNLIKRGHIIKRANSARSLEVVGVDKLVSPEKDSAALSSDHLVDRLESLFAAAEKQPALTDSQLSDLKLVIVALGILGFDEVVERYEARLVALIQAFSDDK